MAATLTPKAFIHRLLPFTCGLKERCRPRLKRLFSQLSQALPRLRRRSLAFDQECFVTG